ncbi:16957_t:CDS:2, partial [Dentiscutata heterogama]
MLTSLLEWPFHKVVLDRVLAQNQNQETLLNDPVEVLEEYQPKRRIQESWFDPIMQPVILEKWQAILRESKANLAPEISTISYPLLKQADTRSQQ